MNPLNKIKALEEKLANYEKMIEDCNEEKQQWKQISHRFADLLGYIKEEIKENGRISATLAIRAENILKEFEKLRDNDKPGNQTKMDESESDS